MQTQNDIRSLKVKKKEKKKEKKLDRKKTGWTSELALSNKIEQEFKTKHVELGGFG